MKKTFVGIAVGLLACIGLSVGLTSCLNSDSPEDPLVALLRDVETIDNYLTTNNITAVKDVNGIRMVITKLGTGFPGQITSSTSSKVDVDYVGKLFTTNAIFDQGNTTGLISNYIDGWKIALTTLPAGSKATLYIPPYWGYGNSANGSIPANSILVFDIEFNDVIETSQELQKLGQDTVAVDNYLASKNIEAIKDSTGLRYVVTELGTGAIPTWYDKVKFKGTYKLLSDDTKVITTINFEPTDNYYNRVIDQIPNGLKQGLQRLPVGSKATFYLASGLGYGAQGASDGTQQIIPANSNIIIDVELTELVAP
jgi:FKBP-type peptidyl-prolyl cis-trans isomerase